MRNSSNVISVSQIISFSHVMWRIPQTAKIDAFFGIAEFFTYRNAQITISVNVLFICAINQHRAIENAEAVGNQAGLGISPVAVTAASVTSRGKVTFIRAE
jgi:hypothetical protein